MYMYSRVPKTCVYTKCIAKYALIFTINVVATFKNKNITNYLVTLTHLSWYLYGYALYMCKYTVYSNRCMGSVVFHTLSIYKG